VLLGFACASACSGPPSNVPAAVIGVTPASVCVADHFQTPILLDSNGSSPVLSLVYAPPAPDAGDLVYVWSFSGAVCVGIPASPGDWTDLTGATTTDCDVLLDPGAVDALHQVGDSTVQLAIAGDRPVDVTLVVTNAAGGSLTAHATISITPLDDAGVCPLPKAR
jgi:hypothetical protein